MDEGNHRARKQAVLDAMEEWLRRKGAPLEGGSFALKGGQAELTRSMTRSSIGEVIDFALVEPGENGRFRTDLSFAFGTGRIAIHAALSAGSESMAPTFFDARCPYVLRSILQLPYGWTYRGFPVGGAHGVLRGKEGAEELMGLVWSPERKVPLVVISEEYNGAMLHPGLPGQMADELASLAMVVHIDAKASWQVTMAKGKEWSCYNGAIRLFWPGEVDEPMQHPLWSAFRLMEDASSVEHAATRIRNQLRRMIFSQSALAVWEPRLIADVRQAAREERIKEQLQQARSAKDFEELAEQYAQEASVLREENKRLEREIRDLNGQLEQLNIALRHKQLGDDAIAPDEQRKPESVKQAVEIARRRFAGELLFGADVRQGIDGLAADAGPPEKILDYLEVLAEMTRSKRSEGLGKSMWLWLQDFGVNGSDEEQQTRTNRAMRTKRTWDNGSGERVYFDAHLKPSDGTSPDRCVRIYFKYDEAHGKTLIGWVGRHPD
jgi:cell division protein FtsB